MLKCCGEIRIFPGVGVAMEEAKGMHCSKRRDRCGKGGVGNQERDRLYLYFCRLSILAALLKKRSGLDRRGAAMEQAQKADLTMSHTDCDLLCVDGPVCARGCRPVAHP